MCSIQRKRRTTQTLACVVISLTLHFQFGHAEDVVERTPSITLNASQRVHVEASGELFTVRAHDVSTGDILDEIARQSDLLVITDNPLVERTSVNIVRLPLTKALRRILRSRSFALRISPPSSNATQSSQTPVATLWILDAPPRGGSGRSGDARLTPTAVVSRIEALQSELNDSNFRLRRQAVTDLREISGDEVIAPLAYALWDEHPEVRAEAVTALGHLGTQRAAAELAMALSDDDHEVQEQAVRVLGNIGGPTAVRLLEDTLGHGDSDLREGAIEALADIGGDASARALAIALQDDDPSLREEAVDALGAIGNETAVQLLGQALSHGDPVVRDAASDVLDELQPTTTVDN